MIFNWEYYVYKNKDLNFISEEQALNHFISFGIKEERIYNDVPILFNWKDYTNNYKDLNRILDEESAWKHFLFKGGNENRIIKHYLILKKYCINI